MSFGRNRTSLWHSVHGHGLNEQNEHSQRIYIYKIIMFPLHDLKTSRWDGDDAQLPKIGTYNLNFIIISVVHAVRAVRVLRVRIERRHNNLYFRGTRPMTLNWLLFWNLKIQNIHKHAQRTHTTRNSLQVDLDNFKCECHRWNAGASGSSWA